MNKWTKVLGVVAATAMFIPLAACGGSRGTTTAGGDGWQLRHRQGRYFDA